MLKSYVVLNPVLPFRTTAYCFVAYFSKSNPILSIVDFSFYNKIKFLHFIFLKTLLSIYQQQWLNLSLKFREIQIENIF